MTHSLVKSPDYAAWLCEMKSRIRSAHLSVARAVNRDMILLYWDIGRGNARKNLEQAVPELAALVPWGHHLEILKKVRSPAARLYYLRATAQFGWTRNVLLNQIKAGAYQRSLAEGKTHNFPSTLPEHLAEQAEEALKSSYNLEFLGISHEIKEREGQSRSGVCAQEQNQSHRRGRIPVAIDFAGGTQRQTPDIPTTEGSLGPIVKSRRGRVP